MDHLISIFLAAFFLAVTAVTVLHGYFIRKESEKRERQLLMALAHDIRTPLTVVRGYAEGLLDGVADTEEKRRAYLSQIRSKTMEMDDLLSDLMLYAKATSGGMTYDMGDIHVSEELSTYVSSVREDISLRKASISLSDETGGDCVISGDRGRLKRVLDNLISNSLKYKKGDAVSIGLLLSEAHDELQLTISDDGRGIRAGDVPYIFDHLYRGDGGSGISGSGVGLWLVKRITEDHGGHVWAESEYGAGTRIHLVMRTDHKEI